jgi:dipeptidase D
MTSALADLEPKEVWKHFDALTKIPRPSTREAQVSQYVLALAGRCRLEVMQDRSGNMVIRKPAHAGRAAVSATTLQGHLDMVCEKNEATTHNFDTDPIEVVRDDDGNVPLLVGG